MKPPELFAVTQPRHLIDINPNPESSHLLNMSAEESIVYMARVSSPNQRTEDAEKLLTYLVKHGHWSPFDMVDMTLKIETSRAIMAQILRHWSFRFQEFSQRYASVETGIDWSHAEAREKHVQGNRQGSGQKMHWETSHMTNALKNNEDVYAKLVKYDVAPECARMVLPLATPTQAYMKGSVRSWMTYFWQRCDMHAQKEHRLLAEQMFEIFKQEFPITANLVENYKPQIVERNQPGTLTGEGE